VLQCADFDAKYGSINDKPLRGRNHSALQTPQPG